MQGPGEEGLDHGADLGGVEGFSAVAGAREDDQFAPDSGGLQARVKATALFDGDLRVGVAVEDQERRVVGGNLIKGAGGTGEVGPVAHDAAEEQRAVGLGEVGIGFAGAGDVGRHGEEVAGAVEIDHALDAAGGLLVHGGGGGADQCRDVAAGGAAGDGDAARVEAVGGGVFAQPADGGARVFELGRPTGNREQADVEAGDGVALGGEPRERAVALGAAFPAAAVHPDDDGERILRQTGGAIEVERERARSGGRIRERSGDLGAGRSGRGGGEEGRQRQTEGGGEQAGRGERVVGVHCGERKGIVAGRDEAKCQRGGEGGRPARAAS